MKQVIVPPKGRVRGYQVTRDAWSLRTPWQHNLLLYEWGAIVGPLLLRQGLNFGIGGMYIEFQNVVSPGDPADIPSFSRDADQGVSYYNDLITSPDQDYLRVPLVSGLLSSTDAVKYPKGNATTFFAQSSGVVGVHGKTFSDSVNSVVTGGALVAFVNADDASQDRIFARFYFELANQMPKLSVSQIGIEWNVALK